MTTDLETAAEIIGIGRTLAYELAKTGAFPVRLLRLGRRVLVPVADLRTFLGLPAGTDTDPERNGTADHSGGAATPSRASGRRAPRGRVR